MFMAALMTLSMMAGQPAEGAPQRFRGELDENLSSAVDHSIIVHGRLEDAELCLADSVYAVGVPVVLRDGPDKFVIAAFGAASPVVFVTISLSPAGEGSWRADIRVRGRGWDDRMAERVRGCFRAQP
jgi:hypothetical protein